MWKVFFSNHLDVVIPQIIIIIIIIIFFFIKKIKFLIPLLIVIVKIQWTDKNKMLRNYNQLLV